jgi:hypothetical protein
VTLRFPEEAVPIEVTRIVMHGQTPLGYFARDCTNSCWVDRALLGAGADPTRFGRPCGFHDSDILFPT